MGGGDRSLGMRQADTRGRVREQDRGTDDPAGGTMRMLCEGVCTKAGRSGEKARKQESWEVSGGPVVGTLSSHC